MRARRMDCGVRKMQNYRLRRNGSPPLVSRFRAKWRTTPPAAAIPNRFAMIDQSTCSAVALAVVACRLNAARAPDQLAEDGSRFGRIEWKAGELVANVRADRAARGARRGVSRGMSRRPGKNDISTLIRAV